MKVAIVGQQDFGKAVLEKLIARGDEIAAVFCAPEKEGARPDALRVAAQEKGLKVHQFKSLKAPEAVEVMKAANADIGIMAYVLQFAPQEFVNIPKRGTIQYHHRCCRSIAAPRRFPGQSSAAKPKPVSPSSAPATDSTKAR